MAVGNNIKLGFAEADSGGFNPSVTLTPERFEIQITRNPSVIALPNQNGSNRGNSGHGTGIPKNILIDFGMMNEAIVIEGKIPDEDQSQINNNLVLFISKFRTHWVNTPTVYNINTPATGNGLMKVQLLQEVPSGIIDMTWGVTPIRVRFNRPPARAWWEYSLTLGVVIYPEAATNGFTS